MSRYSFLSAALLLCLPLLASAKDTPSQVVVWPEQGTPVLRFSFSKFKEIGSGLGHERTYVSETTAENLWSKPISSATFSLFLYDKNRVRIGEATLSVSSVAPGESVKFQTTIAVSGPPASVAVAARWLPPELGALGPVKTISMTINTVPQEAVVKVDGTEVGVTPKIIKIAVGKHLLEFTKEGFNPGKFPLEISPDDVSGGSVSYELGTSAQDTIEMRDGSVLTGDLESVSATEVVIRAGGKNQTYDRNQVKRILLVQRETAPDSATQSH
jgi:hypothetical protein